MNNHDSLIQRVESAVRRPADLRSSGWRTESMLEFMARENIPGASVAVIDGGEIAWAKAYGVLEAGKPSPVTVETRFQAASISKPVASIAALSLVQDGILALDEDIRAWQKRWALPDNNGWQPRVTLRQLLSHSGGITVGGFPGYTQDVGFPNLVQVLNGEGPANTPPIFCDTLPGLQFRYSGGGYTILQALLEDASGLPFWQLAKERVLAPAGMRHSTYQIPLPTDGEPFAATGHRADGQPLAGRWHLYPESAAAGLWTTPLDLARLVVILERTLAGMDEMLISRALVEEMTRPQARLHGIELEGWEGLGLFLTQEGEEWYYGHGGSNEGYRCSLIVRKSKGQAAVIMTNSDSGGELNDAWEASVAVEYGWPGFAWTPPAPVPLDAAALARFTGAYQLESGSRVEVVEGARGLELVYPGQPPLVMIPRAPERFFLSQLNGEMSFTLDGNHCSGLKLMQNNDQFLGNKIS